MRIDRASLSDVTHLAWTRKRFVAQLNAATLRLAKRRGYPFPCCLISLKVDSEILAQQADLVSTELVWQPGSTEDPVARGKMRP